MSVFHKTYSSSPAIRGSLVLTSPSSQKGVRPSTQSRLNNFDSVTLKKHPKFGSAAANAGAWSTLQSAAVHGVIAVPLEMAFASLIAIVHSELRPLDEKLDKLLHSPILTAERHLELAKLYPEKSANQLQSLQEARNFFNVAASNLEGSAKGKALISAAVCSTLMGDPVGTDFYRKKAIQDLKLDLAKVEKSSLKAGTAEATGILSTWFGSTSGVLGTIAAASAGFLIPALIIGGTASIMIGSGMAATKYSSSIWGEIDEIQSLIRYLEKPESK